MILKLSGTFMGTVYVPVNYPDNSALGVRCNHKRDVNRKTQKAEDPHCNLLVGIIERLEEIGFIWKVQRRI